MGMITVNTLIVKMRINPMDHNMEGENLIFGPY